MTARQVTDLILNNKVNYLSSEDRNALAEKVLKNNPSVFENGKVKEGFDINKLDIPTIKYIKENYVKSRDFTTMKGSGEYQSTNSKTHKVISTINGKYGRYAKLEMDNNDGHTAKWHYYAQDGSELNEKWIQDTDPELYNRTHGE